MTKKGYEITATFFVEADTEEEAVELLIDVLSDGISEAINPEAFLDWKINR